MKEDFVEFIKNKKGFKRRFWLDSISEVEYIPTKSKFIHVFKGDKEYQFEDNNFNLSSMKMVNDYLQRKKQFLESVHKARCKKLGKSYYGRQIFPGFVELKKLKKSLKLKNNEF